MSRIFKKAIYLLFDLLATLFSVVLLPLLIVTRKYKVENFPLQLRLFKWWGVFPIVEHYYEPKFVYGAAFDAAITRSLPIEIDGSRQLVKLSSLNYVDELKAVPKNQKASVSNSIERNKSSVGLIAPTNLENTSGFYLNNGNFGAGDAELYYLLIRNRKPKRIIEIGAGFSTQLSLLALEKNRTEGAACELTCIEPFEMPFLEKLEGIHLMRQTVETVSLDLFQSLEANDILFIDSSHIIRPGDDLLFIYFQILPILRKGVLIHIHDIFTPRHYPKEWLTQKMRFWNEQYLLEAFLYNNSGFEILFTLNHLVKTEFAAAKKVLIHLEEDSEPSSFWMERQ